MQRNLRRLLEDVADWGSVVDTEFAFRALPEYELRVADVAWVAAGRLKDVDLESHFRGTPELVVEVLSPSNTAAGIYDKEKLCLENGAQEFWVVDPDRHQVKVSTPDGRTVTYQSGQEIPLPLFGNAKLAVNAILIEAPAASEEIVSRPLHRQSRREPRMTISWWGSGCTAGSTGFSVAEKANGWPPTALGCVAGGAPCRGACRN